MSGLEPPPPYSRNDPHSPTSPTAQTTGVRSTANAVETLTVSNPHTSDASQPHSTELSPTYAEDRQDQAPSPSLSQNIIYTPPASPCLTQNQHNDIGLDQTTLSASAAYFESRPSIMQTPPEPFIYRLVLLPDSGPNELPFPEPEHMWWSRDITQQDWDTFKNYLFPYYQMEANTQIAERKMQAELDRRLEDDIAGENAEPPTNELFPAQLEALPGVREQNEKRSLNHDTSEPEAERSRRINSTIAEWNEGFFQPRGFHVESTLVPYSTAPLLSTTTTVDPGRQPEQSESAPAAVDELNQPLSHRPSSDSSTLNATGSTSTANCDDDPIYALRQALGKFLLSSKEEMAEAFDDLGSELRSQKSANLHALKQELQMTKRDFQLDWKSIMHQHKQMTKLKKGKGKWKKDDDSEGCPRKGKEEKIIRKAQSDMERVERKQRQDAEKRELKEAKKRLKEEHKRQVRELYQSKTKGCPTQERARERASESIPVEVPEPGQETGVEIAAN
jgi:hypothetical protein